MASNIVGCCILLPLFISLDAPFLQRVYFLFMWLLNYFVSSDYLDHELAQVKNKQLSEKYILILYVQVGSKEKLGIHSLWILLDPKLASQTSCLWFDPIFDHCTLLLIRFSMLLQVMLSTASSKWFFQVWSISFLFYTIMELILLGLHQVFSEHLSK